MTLLRIRLLLLVSVALLPLAACDGGAPVSAAAANAAPVAPSRSAPAARFYQASGPLVVEDQVDVAAQRDGVVAAIMAEVGARVHKGQILAQLDDRQLTAEHDAAVAKARSIEQDEKNWETEIKIVETDLARDEQMFKYQLITQQQLEHSRYKLVGAKQQQERELQSTREAQATAKALELELEKTRIMAPFDGVVARRYVRAGQSVAKNDRLFWVTATGPLNVRFTVPQDLIARVKPGDMLPVSAPGSSTEHQAKVTLVSPVVDPSSGTVEVQAQMTGSTTDLLPGMTVSIKIPTP